MKTLIVTVAGTATRFNRDTEEEVLKCLYYKDSPDYSLLYQILWKSDEMDEIVIVGGYLYEKLTCFIQQHCKPFLSRIKLVYNEHYITYGSGYSLLKGIEAAKSASEIVFVEGDLYFDSTDYEQVLRSSKDVLTVNREFILSDKAVVVYINSEDQIRYVYDTRHQFLCLPEAVKAIYNSAQIWKFTNVRKLSDVILKLSSEQIQGTNLEIIQGYFCNINAGDVRIIPMETWYNCNMVSDYMNIYKQITK